MLTFLWLLIASKWRTKLNRRRCRNDCTWKGTSPFLSIIQLSYQFNAFRRLWHMVLVWIFTISIKGNRKVEFYFGLLWSCQTIPLLQYLFYRSRFSMFTFSPMTFAISRRCKILPYKHVLYFIYTGSYWYFLLDLTTGLNIFISSVRNNHIGWNRDNLNSL